jgi:hypothetical protein
MSSNSIINPDSTGRLAYEAGRNAEARLRSLTGIDTRKAIRIAIELGCCVEHVRRTGEQRVSHPGIARRVRINARRRDAGRQLTTFLHHVRELQSADGRLA